MLIAKSSAVQEEERRVLLSVPLTVCDKYGHGGSELAYHTWLCWATEYHKTTYSHKKSTFSSAACKEKVYPLITC